MTADKAVSFEDSVDSPDDSSSSLFDPASLLPSPTTGKSTPQPNRSATKAALHALLSDTIRPSPCNVFGSGPLLVSNIPQSARPDGIIDTKNDTSSTSGGVIMGIDEAGRGPALGPMTYGAAYWHPTKSQQPIPPDFNDSKQLSAEKRQVLFRQIQSHDDIGFVLRVIHASEISRNMMRKTPYNLNAMSHDCAMEMIWAVLHAGVTIDTCYVDTVGMPDAYRQKLERVFEGYNINFVVEKKADAKYAPCSAASVVAKESRDAIVQNWKWSEMPNFIPQSGHEFGSGYPSDPKCVQWMKSNCNVDRPFGFPDFVRFSWGPTKKLLGEGPDAAAAAGGGDGGSNNDRGKRPIIKWEADEDDESNNDGGGKQSSMQSFVVTKKVEDNGKKAVVMQPKRKKPRLAIFNEMGVSKVAAFA
ncbi:ribonuclease H2 subunit A [Skeletonema marinoi]|uniref:Ribonuclease n=1 Tax=Skeletonema marinoi TaxID=267567 RepID=A0AAD9D6I9_9STRA|nr:ribonuclease H2 subunit A [Skeletonema marinoi]